MDLLRKGSEWLGRQMSQHAASPVLYYRGGSSTPTFTLNATLGATSYPVGNTDVGVMRARVRDYLVNTSEIIDAATGRPYEPRPGDRIVETVGGFSQTYEVADLPGENCWRWSGGFQNRIRIHTKFAG